MSDVLIRDVPDDILSRIDTRAKQLGLSREELLHLALKREADEFTQRVTVEDLERFSHEFADLSDPEVMRKAWR